MPPNIYPLQMKSELNDFERLKNNNMEFYSNSALLSNYATISNKLQCLEIVNPCLDLFFFVLEFTDFDILLDPFSNTKYFTITTSILAITTFYPFSSLFFDILS